MKINLPNGVVLDDAMLMAPTLAQWAHQKGLKDVRVFVADDDEGTKSYLLVLGEQPEFESNLAEAVAAHIDMLALQKVHNG